MLQSKMADMYVKLNTARSYTYNVARAIDNGLSSASKVNHLLLIIEVTKEVMCLPLFVCLFVWFICLLVELLVNK